MIGILVDVAYLRVKISLENLLEAVQSMCFEALGQISPQAVGTCFGHKWITFCWSAQSENA